MTEPRPARGVNRRRALALLALGAAAPTALAACAEGTGAGGAGATAAPPPRPSVTLHPADAARDVVPVGPYGARVRDGRFERLTLTGADGRVVAATMAPDGTSFTVAEPLGYDARYRWDGVATGPDGTQVTVSGTFSTVAPTATVNGRFQLSDGQTVGVAAPIILQFDAAVDAAARAGVERAVTVTTTPATEGGWAWLPDEVGGSRMHWRPREYFAAGTTVSVDARLYGVDFGGGAFGARDATLDVAIGRRQVVRAEASSHRIQVLDGAGTVVMDLPCSYGEGDLDRNVTRSGIHVVTERYEDFFMTNPAAGYADVRERFAVRISNNGEFIHANPASLGAQGNSNVTNGCINLSLDDAERYFATAIYGDPVEVTGTRIDLSYDDGDIWDWTVPWPQWQAMSALAPR